MNHEVMLEDIKAELDHLDAAALQSIRKIINQSKRSRSDGSKARQGSDMPLIDIETVKDDDLQFVGENLTPEEYKKLTLQERGILQWRLQMQNHFWLEKTFSKLNAAWLVVVDGHVITSGRSLKNLPMQPQVRRICRRMGKFPFIFVNDKFIAIEEIVSSWSKTKQTGDYYPTISVTLRSASNAIDVVGDFDTGASHTFVGYDFLAAQNVIQPEPEDYPIASLHLSQRFTYVAKWLQVELPSNSDETRNLIARVFCVSNWRLSPFVDVNPNRTALIGRDIMLELKPNLRLDFEKRQTEISPAEKPRQARRKNSGKKKRTKPRSFRRR
jgi:hypothetical protein